MLNIFGRHTGYRPISLINDITKAINGQYSAIHCYTELAKNAPNASERNQILEIRNDENRHHQEFSRIYLSLTRRRPTQQIIEPCSRNYKQGLEAAFKDEQETVDFYLNITDKTQDHYIKERFRRAAADE